MSSKKIWVILVILIAVIIGIYFFDSSLDKESDQNYKKIDYYVKNKSWDTQKQKEIPYKKWDKIEYTFILRNYNNFWQKVDVIVSKIREKLNLKNPQITWTDLISWDSAWTISIVGEAIDNGISSKDFDNLFDFENLPDQINDQEKNNQEKKEQEKHQEINDSKISFNFPKIHFSSNLNNLILLSWENLKEIKSINIWKKEFDLVEKKSKYYINIPKNTFEAWKYDVSLRFKNWNKNITNKTLNFDYSEWKVFIIDIFPSKIKNDIPRWITVQWDGLENTISVQLSNSNILKNTSDYKIVSDDVIAVKIPSWISTWDYYINIMTLDWIYKFEDKKFKVY